MKRQFEFPQTRIGIDKNTGEYYSADIVKCPICGEKLDVAVDVYLHPVKILTSLGLPCAFSGRTFKFEHFKNIIEGFEQLSRMNAQAVLPVIMRDVDTEV